MPVALGGAHITGRLASLVLPQSWSLHPHPPPRRRTDGQGSRVFLLAAFLCRAFSPRKLSTNDTRLVSNSPHCCWLCDPGRLGPCSTADRPPGRRHQRGLVRTDDGCIARGGGLRRAACERHSHAPDEAVRGGWVQDDPAQGRLLLRRAEGALTKLFIAISLICFLLKNT